MSINISSALSAYANAGKIGAGAATPAAGGTSFGQMVQDAAKNVMDNLGKSEQASMQAATGKADLAAVTEAVTNAQVSLQTAVAVRDRVIAAYQDIIKMPM
jgi:flagellar hook-basal body complex protein FliE